MVTGGYHDGQGERNIQIKGSTNGLGCGRGHYIEDWSGGGSFFFMFTHCFCLVLREVAVWIGIASEHHLGSWLGEGMGGNFLI